MKYNLNQQVLVSIKGSLFVATVTYAGDEGYEITWNGIPMNISESRLDEIAVNYLVVTTARNSEYEVACNTREEAIAEARSQWSHLSDYDKNHQDIEVRYDFWLDGDWYSGYDTLVWWDEYFYSVHDEDDEDDGYGSTDFEEAIKMAHDGQMINKCHLDKFGCVQEVEECWVVENGEVTPC